MITRIIYFPSPHYIRMICAWICERCCKVEVASKSKTVTGLWFEERKWQGKWRYMYRVHKI